MLGRTSVIANRYGHGRSSQAIQTVQHKAGVFSRRRPRPVLLAVSLALTLALTSPPSNSGVLAAANDPTYSNVWGTNYYGVYYFHSADFTLGWMKSAVNTANATIGHRTSRNPDFHETPSTFANGAVHYMSSVTNLCDGAQYWKACADAYSNQTFRLWFASNYCWTDGTNSTCGGTQYDVETVALNEMGHVNRLQHHVNPAYADAVVQAAPYPFSNATYGKNRALRWADIGALNALYGVD